MKPKVLRKISPVIATLFIFLMMLVPNSAYSTNNNINCQLRIEEKSYQEPNRGRYLYVHQRSDTTTRLEVNYRKKYDFCTIQPKSDSYYFYIFDMHTHQFVCVPPNGGRAKLRERPVNSQCLYEEKQVCKGNIRTKMQVPEKFRLKSRNPHNTYAIGIKKNIPIAFLEVKKMSNTRCWNALENYCKTFKMPRKILHKKHQVLANLCAEMKFCTHPDHG